jgi:glycosyltransferase involved in cell wall biosynthesis
MKFNLPERVSHHVRFQRFAPLQYVWAPLGAVGLYWPSPACDLVHSMNRIPMFPFKPWVVTFESVLPRTLTGSGHWLFRQVRERLVDQDCLGIVAMSAWARNMFEFYNRDWPGLQPALAKTVVLHPSIVMQTPTIRRWRRDEPLRILFIGNDFARKGGVVAVRLAKRAMAEGLPIELHIVSALRYGPNCHADHQDRRAYESDIELLNLPNVHVHGMLSNSVALERMAASHLTFLPTLHDTYGFSVLEGFSCGTPAITSNVCAQPEINGIAGGVMLSLPTDAQNRWVALDQYQPQEYWDIVNSAYESLASQAFLAVEKIHDNPEIIESMSLGAINAVRIRHDPETCAAVLQEIYAKRARA